MASPQLENGYSRLANDLLEALIHCPPATVSARQLWDWIWRESWGRKGAMNTRPTSVRALAEELGLSNGTAGRAIEDLLATNHAVRNEDGSFSIQKDHERWIRDTRHHRAPPQAKQLVFLEDSTVPTAGTKRPHGGDKTSPRRGQNCPHGGDKTVPTAGTDTIRYVKKERKKKAGAASRTPGDLPSIESKNDTPRIRAEAGDSQRPPEEHPDFAKLPFKRRDELTDRWNEQKAKNACRKKCGAPRASDTWPFCRPCTKCALCQRKPDNATKFRLVRGEILCETCEKTDGGKS